MNSVWIVRKEGYPPKTTSRKDPKGEEFIPLNDYHDLIDWIGEYKSCKWEPDDNGIYFTSCGEAFEFTNDGPAENNARFCMYCGNKIIAS